MGWPWDNLKMMPTQGKVVMRGAWFSMMGWENDLTFQNTEERLGKTCVKRLVDTYVIIVCVMIKVENIIMWVENFIILYSLR